jgi:hypothetical protein
VPQPLLSRTSLTQTVARKIQGMIMSGELKADEKKGPVATRLFRGTEGQPGLSANLMSEADLQRLEVETDNMERH